MSNDFWCEMLGAEIAVENMEAQRLFRLIWGPRYQLSIA